MSNVVLRSFFLSVFLISFPMLCGADEKMEQSPVSQQVQQQAQQENAQQQDNKEEVSASVIQSFATDNSAKSELVAVADRTKRLVMFAMGVPLLILLFATAALGVAMGVYGKQVFVPHMVCAGLSLTLALGHAVAGIVWFYPF